MKEDHPLKKRHMCTALADMNDWIYQQQSWILVQMRNASDYDFPALAAHYQALDTTATVLKRYQAEILSHSKVENQSGAYRR